ncbi:MAG: hypothetical protein AABW63_01320 [Nanoarchaeota archaeon]
MAREFYLHDVVPKEVLYVNNQTVHGGIKHLAVDDVRIRGKNYHPSQFNNATVEQRENKRRNKKGLALVVTPLHVEEGVFD